MFDDQTAYQQVALRPVLLHPGMKVNKIVWNDFEQRLAGPQGRGQEAPEYNN